MAFRPRYANASSGAYQPNRLPLQPKSSIDYRLLCAASRQGISLKYSRSQKSEVRSQKSEVKLLRLLRFETFVMS
ncbi:hypothetical protein [Moorena sp. SIO4G3]|uniref:hypothetical protein n=1 Tax=Moorena sp. SIO4G3 TaxID=2607821 RepID=UPI00142B5A13|nr:hypothetical protein [Moorena sp. SIO4G3]NEO75411.1 hypothetical protein [Moorena sp. SIO4G3]